jgi:tetratricopeptide (TPR) repeat protein
LRRIIDDYGRDVIEDPLRVEGLLRDLAAGHRRDVFLLVQALRTGVVRALLDAERATSGDLVAQQCVRRLQDDLGLAPDAAAWTVATWADVLGVTGVVVPSPSTTEPDRMPTREEQLVAAQTHVVNGRRRAALRDLNDYVLRNPDDAVALAVRADVYRMLGKIDRAFADAEAALAIDAASPVALRVRGEVHRRRGELEDALRDLNRSLALERKSPQALLSRGETYRDLHRAGAALVDLNRSIALAPGPEAYAARSILHAQQERRAQALDDAKRAIAWGADAAADKSLRAVLQRVQHGALGAKNLAARLPVAAPVVKKWTRKKLKEWRERRPGDSEK